MKGACWIALGLVLGGCQAGYLIDQALGHLRLYGRRRPLDSEGVSASLGPDAARKLALCRDALRFAEDELGLSVGDAYTTYLDTRGEPVSWIVTAAHPTALVPYRWCFPFVGCVSYKGYFQKEDADAEARRLLEEGWDAEVLPVSAYSTLGWFPDPILSTMLDRSGPSLLELLFHELTHRTLYISGAVEFNESLATHVGREGVREYLLRRPHALRPGEVEAYLAENRRRDQLDELLARLRRDLTFLYRSDLPVERILERKAELFASARRAAAYAGLSPDAVPRSNAGLVAHATYRRYLPALARLQERVGGRVRDLMAYLMELDRGKATLDEVLRQESAQR